MEGVKRLVCVTGGTGYIASWLIMRLLEQGYYVRCTVRHDPEGKKDISYLTNLPGASERLRIFHADLNKPDSFKEAIEGCIGVFHVAHPVEIKGKEPEEVVSKRTVEGTIGILKACLNSRTTVKRVVYTSSAATALFDGKKDQDIVDESSWSDIELSKSLEIRDNSYTVSKVKTERAALEFAEEHGLNLVAVLPSLVLGPFICPSIPFSVSMGLSMILGKQELYEYLISVNMVHIDDLARAQIFLFEYPTAKGRYICSSSEITISEMAELLSNKYPNFQIPEADELKEIKGFKLCRLTSKKLVDSGFKFQYGLGDMFDGAVQSCKEKGFLSMK